MHVPITIKLDRFEGPLDLLLFLIQSHELDISKVSISKITDQYLQHIKLMQDLNFEVASEFLVMAASLIYWKSKAILPQEQKPVETDFEDNGILSQEDLIRQLLELQRFRAAGETLAGQPLLGEDVFTRPNSKPPIEKVWRDMNITDLGLSFQDILMREKRRARILKKETVSIGEKILEFGQLLPLHTPTELRSLLRDKENRGEVVVTFLGALELSKLLKMRVHQLQTFDPIYLELLEKVLEQDVRLAISFEKPANAENPENPTPVEATL